MYIEQLKQQSELKFNHVYISDVVVPDCNSDINEEVSLYGTEKISDLATEHCSDAKNGHSQKPVIDTSGKASNDVFSLPSL